jgi:hypothetical protein
MLSIPIAVSCRNRVTRRSGDRSNGHQSEKEQSTVQRLLRAHTWHLKVNEVCNIKSNQLESLRVSEYEFSDVGLYGVGWKQLAQKTIKRAVSKNEPLSVTVQVLADQSASYSLKSPLRIMRPLRKSRLLSFGFLQILFINQVF